MESSPPAVGKRLWKIARIVYFMIHKGISKSKWMADLHPIMQRGKIAGKKAIGSLMFQNHPTFICQSDDVYASYYSSFYAPREYEFSCSNTPAYPSFHVNKRHRRRHHHPSTLHKALDRLSSDTQLPPSPGFGWSPAPRVRQLRISDSPFSLRDNDVDCHVDMEAEEFIKRFYEELKLQKRMAALEARCYEDMLLGG